MATEVIPLECLKQRVGQEIGKSEWFQIDQQLINAFAVCTGERQWIHVDEKISDRRSLWEDDCPWISDHIHASKIQ